MAYERTRLTADTTIFASPNGAGLKDGSSPANAFAGVQAAWNALQQNYDLNGQTATIQLLDGTYNAGLQGYGPMVGMMKPGGSPVIVRGDPTASGVNFDTPGVNTFSFDGNAIATITNLTVSASGACPLYATYGGIIEFGSIRFGTAMAHVMSENGGSIIGTGSYAIIQGAVYHVIASGAGSSVGIVPGVSASISPNVGFSQFAFAGRLGKISIPLPGVVFSGACSGQQGFASLLGLLDCGGGAGSLPGNVACGSNYGGQVY